MTGKHRGSDEISTSFQQGESPMQWLDLSIVCPSAGAQDPGFGGGHCFGLALQRAHPQPVQPPLCRLRTHQTRHRAHPLQGSTCEQFCIPFLSSFVNWLWSFWPREEKLLVLCLCSRREVYFLELARISLWGKELKHWSCALHVLDSKIPIPG